MDIKFEHDWDLIKKNLHLGLCCINNGLNKQGIKTGATCRRAGFTVARAKELALSNIANIKVLIKWNVKHKIRCFRIGSDIFPHYTDEKCEKYSMDFAKEALAQVGDYIKSKGIRVLMHPGQFNHIGAKDKKVLTNTIADLQMHADILDNMGIDDNGVLIVHGGGKYDDKEATIKRWIKNFHSLPESIKKRLVIENCERIYSVEDCLKISKGCNIPMLFDWFHHKCWNTLNPVLKIDDYIKDIIASWGNRRIVMHLSEQQKDGRLGAHSEFVKKIPDKLFSFIEEYNIEVDLEIEAKGKEEAILQLYKKYSQIFL